MATEYILYYSQTGKFIPAVRETIVSPQDGFPVEGPSYTPPYLSAVMYEGFQMALNWAPMMAVCRTAVRNTYEHFPSLATHDHDGLCMS